MLLWTHVQVLVWLHGHILISLRIYWGVELLGHVVTTTSKARGLQFLCILASTCCLSSWLQLPWAKWHLPGALTCISLMTDDAERPSCVSTSWALLSLPSCNPIPILSAQLQQEMATASFSLGLSPSNQHVHAVFVIIKLNFALSSSHTYVRINGIWKAYLRNILLWPNQTYIDSSLGAALARRSSCSFILSTAWACFSISLKHVFVSFWAPKLPFLAPS